MRILLDTHILLWWLDGHGRLRPKVRKLLADGKNELLWSAASTWELAIKAQIGKADCRSRWPRSCHASW